jgi:hypothetical protein
VTINQSVVLARRRIPLSQIGVAALHSSSLLCDQPKFALFNAVAFFGRDSEPLANRHIPDVSQKISNCLAAFLGDARKVFVGRANAHRFSLVVVT